MENGFRIQFPFRARIFAMLLVASCANEPKPSPPHADLRPGDDTIVKMNRQAVKDETREIDDYIERHHWNLERSSTGLRYYIYPTGSGPKSGKGKLVAITYSVRLLTGEVVAYPGSEKEFELGRSKVESGLEEGILMMRKGDRAKFIIPSHLAFGLLGDMNKIPPRATLVYEVELKKISDP